MLDGRFNSVDVAALAQRFGKINEGIVRLFTPHVQRKYNGTQILNEHGDRRLVAGKFGADISLQRPDTLDQIALHCVDYKTSRGEAVNVIDIGGGIGAQALRFAIAGSASVTLVDVTNQKQNQILAPDNVASALGSAFGSICPIRVLNEDIRAVISDERRNIAPECNVFFSQRMWSAMPYEDALKTLTYFVARDDRPALFFVSAVGLDSEFGPEYPHRNKRVEERWSHHGKDMADKHGVTEPECLYGDDDLRQQFERANLKVIHVWQSGTGNPRIIAARPSVSDHMLQVTENLVRAYACI